MSTVNQKKCRAVDTLPIICVIRNKRYADFPSSNISWKRYLTTTYCHKKTSTEDLSFPIIRFSIEI